MIWLILSLIALIIYYTFVAKVIRAFYKEYFTQEKQNENDKIQ